MIYRKLGNLRAVQLPLGNTKLESTIRYLGLEVDDAVALSEHVDLRAPTEVAGALQSGHFRSPGSTARTSPQFATLVVFQ
jgi:phage tail tube protein FII